MKASAMPPDQVFDACAILDNYHRRHTTATFTHFRNEDGSDIYVVSDPKWKKKMLTFTAPLFPAEVAK